MRDRILLMRAGGTIDAEPYADPHCPPALVHTLKGDDSLIMRTVAAIPHGDRLDGLSWGSWQENRFVKDSQEFTADDIEALAEVIRQVPQRCIMLTHGTDAMAPNAALLKAALGDTHKVIAFTGAMVPLSMAQQHPSDAVDALAFTLHHLDQQPAGVYVVGRDPQTKRLAFHDPERVQKDKTTSRETLAFTLAPR